MGQKAGRKTGRLASVDFLRGVAILLMMQVHFVQNLSVRAGWEGLYDISVALGCLAAPIFTFLAGFSLWLWLEKAGSLGPAKTGATGKVVRRSLALFAAGLVFAVVIWLPKELFDWDILTFIGSATIILYSIRRGSTGVLTVFALALLAVCPHFRDLTGYGSHWRDGEYYYQFKAGEVGLGYLLQGYFPLFPWMVFPIAGFLSARLTRGFRELRAVRGMIVLGAVLMGLSALGVLGGNCLPGSVSAFTGPLSFYPASNTFVIGVLGLTMVMAGLAHQLLDAGGKTGAGWIARYGRFSLTTYLVHHAVHVWPMYAVALALGPGDIERFYGNAMSPPAALALFALFTVVFAQVLGAWERRGGTGSFEHLLRRISG